MPAFTINFFTQSVTLTLKNRKGLKKCLNQLINQERNTLNTGVVSIIFCDDRYLYELNTRFLNHTTLTDIITFDYSYGNEINGDIFISVERVKENAKKYSQSYRKELSRVIIHGFLHLCGYKDKKKEDKLQMTQKEDFYLGILEKNFNGNNDKKN
jgi:probable rRNA maturation factor